MNKMISTNRSDNNHHGRSVAIGIFDGVHLGHQELLTQTIRLARQGNLRSCVLTFDPHPAQVLAPEFAPTVLEPIEMRLKRLTKLGIEENVVQNFSSTFAAIEPEHFIRNILVHQLHSAHIIVGEGFVFGANQRGSVATLQSYGQQLGFEVHPVPHVRVHNMVVSSTKIREFLRTGEVRGANVLLGRAFALSGTVVQGAGRGKQLGFPTANIETNQETIPASGVYLCHAIGDFGRRPAVVNIGYSPTFSETKLRIEAHILDFGERTLYDTTLTIEFEDRLREERRFSSVEDLKSQIRRDIEHGRKLLRSTTNESQQ